MLPDRYVRLGGGTWFLALGAAVSAHSSRHVLAAGEPLIGRFLGLLTIGGVVVPLLLGAAWLWRPSTAVEAGDALRIFAWSAGVMVALVGASALFVRYQNQHGVTLAEPTGVLIWVAGVGALGGLVTGVYEYRLRTSRRRQESTANRMAALVDATPVPLLEYDGDGSVRWWNEAAAELFDIPADEAGKRLPALWEAADDSHGDLRERMLAGEDLSNAEVSFDSADGHRHAALLSTASVHDDAAPGAETTMAALVDVTERRRRRDELALFRTLLDQSTDSIFLVDAATGEFLDVNDTACAMLGYDRDELLDMSVRDVESSLTSEADWQRHVATLREQGSMLYEGQQRRQDGTTVPVEVNITHVEQDREYIVAIARDVTERKRREQDLSRFRQAVENVGYALYITDTDGTIEYVNDAFEDLTGYSRAEAIGRDPSLLSSGEHDDQYYERLWETILGGEEWTEPVVNRRKSGERYTAMQTITPIEASEEVLGFVAIQKDVTARRVRQQRISVLNRLLRHNLRSAVNVIYGHADPLVADLDDPEARTHAETIRRKARELESLSQKAHRVRNALDGTDAGAWPTSADELLGRIVTEARQTHRDADISLDGRIPPVPVDGAIEPAVQELLENAVRHSERAAPTVRVSATVDEVADTLTVAVADDGPGISERESAALREGLETQLQHGSGLGLWLVKWVANSLGGKVEITDNQPRGSVIGVTVPVLATADRAAGDASDCDPAASTSREVPSNTD